VTAENTKYVTLARIVRPQGRRGEVAAEILTDFPERLTRLTSAYLWNEKNEPRRIAIRSCWLSQSHGGQAVFHFEGSDSISDAETFVGLEVQVPMSERVALPAGSYFVTDLIGCEVRERESGNRLGVVREVQGIGGAIAGTPLLVVNSPRGELLIPLAVEICPKIDLVTRSIEILPPEGLLDLNSSE
jgi:16S rRNA processing protein RimM